MKIPSNRWLLIALLNGFGALLANLYQIYFLADKVTDRALDLFEWGVSFHYTHTLALFATGVLFQLAPGRKKRLLQFCGTAFQLGIFLYSGTLYWLAHLEPGPYPALQFLTAVGGGCLVIGWSSLSYASWTIIVLKKGPFSR